MANSSDPLLIKNVMVPTVQLEMNARVGDALRLLDEKNVAYGVISDEYGKPLSVVTREQLITAEADQPLLALTANVPHPVPIEPDDAFDNIMQIRADDLIFNQDLMGIIVQKQGDVQGVLLRETVVDYSLSMLSGRRLAGSPLRHSDAVLFECPFDHEQKYVKIEYYDPRNPPRCSKGHKMKRARE